MTKKEKIIIILSMIGALYVGLGTLLDMVEKCGGW
jgi:hypothetical protein